jgi:hypothetical protein
MRLDTLGPTNDFIIHVIAVSWETSRWVVPIIIVWLYVIGRELTFPVFFSYAVTCFLLLYYIFTPFLSFLSQHMSSTALVYFYCFFFYVYYVFICAALFERAKIYERKHRIINYKLVTEHERFVTEYIYHCRKMIAIIIPVCLIFFCFYTYFHFTFIYVRIW